MIHLYLIYWTILQNGYTLKHTKNDQERKKEFVNFRLQVSTRKCTRSTFPTGRFTQNTRETQNVTQMLMTHFAKLCDLSLRAGFVSVSLSLSSLN